MTKQEIVALLNEKSTEEKEFFEKLAAFIESLNISEEVPEENVVEVIADEYFSVKMGDLSISEGGTGNYLTVSNSAKAARTIKIKGRKDKVLSANSTSWLGRMFNFADKIFEVYDEKGILIQKYKLTIM